MNSLLQEHMSMSPKPADTVSTDTLLTVITDCCEEACLCDDLFGP